MKKTNYHMPTKAQVHHLQVLFWDMLTQLRGRKVLDAHRRRAAQLVLLGVGLTVGTLGLDVIGALKNMENWFYDQRAFYFQFLMPRPSESLVHLDIDDNVINVDDRRWPWRREFQAKVIREMNRANPKLIFLDITYQEADKERPADDAALALAIKESGRVLAPVTLNLDIPSPAPELERRIAAMMMQAGGLAKTEEQILAVIPEAERGKANNAELLSYFIAARKRAVRAAVLEFMQKNSDATLEGVRAALGFKANRRSAIVKVIDEQYTLLLRERAVERFTVPVTQSQQTSIVVPNHIDAPIIAVSGASALSGFVDFVPQDAGDSKVRFVPLWVNFNGRALPHVSLALFCAYRGVPLSTVQFRENGVLIPDPMAANTIFIPTRTLHRRGDHNVAYVADIPWFGGRRWQEMYDVPSHKVIKQHHSLNLITNIFATEDSIQDNVDQVVGSVLFCIRHFNSEMAEGMKATTFTPDQVPELQQWVKDMFEGMIDEPAKELAGLAILTTDQKQQLKDVSELKYLCENIYFPEFKKLLEQRDRQREDVRRKIGEKIVLVGFTATGLVDQYPTPLHNVSPGVVAHGAMVNGMLTNHFWGRAPDYYTYVLTLVLGFVTTLVVALGSPWKATVGALSAIGAYIFLNGFIFFDRYNLVVGVAGPMTAMGASWAGVTLWRFILEIRERKRVTARFSNYVDPALVNFYVQNPDEQAFAGREKEATVVFTDLEGFTTLSEKLGAGTVAILNDYVAKMTPIIRSNNGFVDKFLGDGIMFEFNAIAPNPDHAADALNAVVLMQQAMIGINDSLRARNLPTLKMRVGVNTGTMIVGDAGGGGASNFTVLGDNVNLAARLESANKAFGSLMMVAETSLIAAGKERFAVRPLARIQVKGKEQAVMVFEPLCLAGEVTPEINTLIRLSTAVYDPYVAGDFEGCMKACDAMDAVVGETKFTKLYHKESTHLLAEGAGPDFDGRIALSEK